MSIIELTTNGVKVSADVGNALEEIKTKSETANTLVAEISHFSEEQSRGIKEINRAVGELEKMTQANAAGAQQVAAAGNEHSCPWVDPRMSA